MVAFVAGIKRSLKAEHWRRLLKGSTRHDAVRIDPIGDGSRIDLRDPGPGPERSLSARQELGALERLFANGPVVLKIITGLDRGFRLSRFAPR